MNARCIPDNVFDQPFETLGKMISLHAQAAPNRPALVQDGVQLTYAELDALMDRIATSLQRDGVRPRDSIAICASTSIAYAALFLGGLRAGVAVAPLAPSSSPQSLAGMVQDAKARVFFIDEDVHRMLEPVRDTLSQPLIALDGAKFDQTFNAWLAPAGNPPQPVEIQPDWPFNIIYSSGTTGTPKGIVQPHSMRWSLMSRARAAGYDEQSVTLISTPLYSNTTLTSVFQTLSTGGTMVMMAKFNAEEWLALAQKHRVTHTMLVPVQYQRIMARPDFGDYDLSSFKVKFSTSAPFSAELKADILKRWPGGLVEYYGMTEGGGSCVLLAHEHPDKLHTVGRPSPGHEIRLIDESGKEVAPGETGEVVGHSPGIMVGYHNQPEKTAETEWYDESGRRFIRTGDVGRFDADGFLILSDRKKDIIISGGFNIYPSDIEAVLRQHPDVADTSVIGVPSQRWGETPVAYVVPKREGIDAHSLLQWANERLGKTQRLATIELIETLPRSAIGKVLKRELRDTFQTVGKTL